jgi:hypothetical protein
MKSRVKVEFIKAYNDNATRFKVGNKATMRREKADELIRLKIVQEYSGEWPPKDKTKINLKDLK